MIGDIGEASIERDAGGFAARLRFYGTRRNALAEGANKGSAEQAQEEPSRNEVALHNLKSNVDSFSGFKLLKIDIPGSAKRLV